eukprot:gene55023-biopygen39195
MTDPIVSQADAEIEKLMGLHPKGYDLSLDRIRRLLEVLGNPHLKLPPVIHVAGTNGKGSTIAYLRAILEAAGLRNRLHRSSRWMWASGSNRFVWQEKDDYGLELDADRKSYKVGDVAIVLTARRHAGRQFVARHREQPLQETGCHRGSAALPQRAGEDQLSGAKPHHEVVGRLANAPLRRLHADLGLHGA